MRWASAEGPQREVEPRERQRPEQAHEEDSDRPLEIDVHLLLAQTLAARQEAKDPRAERQPDQAVDDDAYEGDADQGHPLPVLEYEPAVEERAGKLPAQPVGQIARRAPSALDALDERHVADRIEQ